MLPFSTASLIGVEGGNATRIGRFANYLRNLLPSNDPVVMEMASKAIGRLAMAGDTFTAEYVEFEVKRALEWLGADRNEGRRHAAVSDLFFFVFSCLGIGWLGLVNSGRRGAQKSCRKPFQKGQDQNGCQSMSENL